MLSVSKYLVLMCLFFQGAVTAMENFEGTYRAQMSVTGSRCAIEGLVSLRPLRSPEDTLRVSARVVVFGADGESSYEFPESPMDLSTVRITLEEDSSDLKMEITWRGDFFTGAWSIDSKESFGQLEAWKVDRNDPVLSSVENCL